MKKGILVRKNGDWRTMLDPDSKFGIFMEVAPDSIIIVNNDERIVLVNNLTEELFGYSREELVGFSVAILIPDRLGGIHADHQEDDYHPPRPRRMGKEQSLHGRKKDGTEFPVEISLSVIETDQGILIISIIRDMTESRKTEEHLRTSLLQKEILLKEIHHRVKNNLQITSSLLELQSGYVNDCQIRKLFKDSQNRIRAIALVHEKLCESDEFSHINLVDYMQSLVQLLFQSFGVGNRVRIVSDNTTTFLSMVNAVPCGLIINELLSNCLKYAFPNERDGEISMGIEKTDKSKIRVRISDNGIGLPGNFDIEKTESLGFQLVQALVTQLDGQIQVKTAIGTEFVITFFDNKDDL